MSKFKWDKKFRFAIEDKELIQDKLDGRDKNVYPNEADYVSSLFRTVSVDALKEDIELTPEQIQYFEEIKALCPRKLLVIIGGIPTCTKGLYKFGIQRMNYFVYQKPHPNTGDQMSYDDIKEICYSCTQGLTEDERLKAIMEMYEMKEVTIYKCNNPNADSIESTNFKISKFVCPLQEGRKVRIDRTCIKTECKYLIIDVYPLQSRTEEEN